MPSSRRWLVWGGSLANKRLLEPLIGSTRSLCLKHPFPHPSCTGAPRSNNTFFCQADNSWCYLYGAVQATFSVASSACTAAGGSLATYSGKAEQLLVERYFSSKTGGARHEDLAMQPVVYRADNGVCCRILKSLRSRISPPLLFAAPCCCLWAGARHP